MSDKYIDDIFKNCKYNDKQYKIDRIDYLNNIELEKDKLLKEENDKIINERKAAINEDLNRDIELSTIEMEF